VAIIRLGHVIGAISGNLQGINYAQTRFGPVIRKRLQRVNKSTPAQLAQRALFQRVNLDWLTLSDSERLAWSKSASGFKFYNRLGLPFSLSGFGLFKKILLTKNAEGWPDITQPPIMQRTAAPKRFQISISSVFPSLYFLTWDPPQSPASGNINFLLSRPFSSGAINYFTQWVGPWSITPKGPNYDFKTEFLELWGEATAGERIGAQILFWDPPLLPSSPVRDSVTVE